MNNKSVANFKTDFCKMKIDACRAMLERHSIQVYMLWTTPAKGEFAFVEQNGETIKI